MHFQLTSTLESTPQLSFTLRGSSLFFPKREGNLQGNFPQPGSSSPQMKKGLEKAPRAGRQELRVPRDSLVFSATTPRDPDRCPLGDFHPFVLLTVGVRSAVRPGQAQTGHEVPAAASPAGCWASAARCQASLLGTHILSRPRNWGARPSCPREGRHPKRPLRQGSREEGAPLPGERPVWGGMPKGDTWRGEEKGREGRAVGPQGGELKLNTRLGRARPSPFSFCPGPSSFLFASSPGPEGRRKEPGGVPRGAASWGGRHSRRATRAHAPRCAPSVRPRRGSGAPPLSGTPGDCPARARVSRGGPPRRGVAEGGGEGAAPSSPAVRPSEAPSRRPCSPRACGERV